MNTRPITIDVFAAHSVVSSDGVMKGEELSFADELVMDDVYQIDVDASMSSLSLVTDGSDLRRATPPRHIVHLDCCLTFMAPDGGTHDGLVLVQVDGDTIVDIYLLPLGELLPAVDYRLVGIERHTATKHFADAASGSFARGTRITMGDGQMRAIEDLQPGDQILTRDAGKQPLQFLRQATLRATGSFAPVVIREGTLHNARDLVLRPDHRLFVYQREDHLGAGRSEVLIKARLLIDDKTVFRKRGGFIDYFQLIFDEHYIIYAEGIAAESHLVDPRTRAALPDDIAAQNHAHRPHLDYEVKANLIPSAKAARLLRKASAT